ncbi:MAG: hypothetical protein ACKOED_04325 [Aestuariivirga sp.]|uniref:hypothetical protein n=1 Tax=Aestuariivirga sp. TaxID=2650926 RepID=UPI0038D04667
MTEKIHWIGNGRFLPEAPDLEAAAGERDLLQRRGLVKIVEGSDGATVRWSMFSSNWSSLYLTAEWLSELRGPFQLQYYSAGWFNERHEQCWTAADRIRQLIAKSDVHLSQTVYIQKAGKARGDVPPLLQKALKDINVSEDCSIDCAFDPKSQKFRVARIGAQSTIAKLWGLNPVCYPCLSGHSYDQAVSRAYPEVFRTGEPRYDHIYAAMASTRGEVVWVPYQRVVLPLRQERNRRAVRVVTALAKVDISPL